MTKAEQPTITQSVEVTQADIDAVKRFHAESARWMLNAIKNGDPIGEDRDLNHPIYQAFARHRTTSLAAQDGLVEALERCAQIVEKWNHRQNEKVDDIKYIVRNALSAIKGDKS